MVRMYVRQRWNQHFARIRQRYCLKPTNYAGFVQFLTTVFACVYFGRDTLFDHSNVDDGIRTSPAYRGVNLVAIPGFAVDFNGYGGLRACCDRLSNCCISFTGVRSNEFFLPIHDHLWCIYLVQPERLRVVLLPLRVTGVTEWV